MKDFVLKYASTEPVVTNISFVKKLVEYGLVKNFITRLHPHVISTSKAVGLTSFQIQPFSLIEKSDFEQKLDAILKASSGRACLD